MRIGARLVLLAAIGALSLPAAFAGCTVKTCESDCLDEYNDCLDRAPPGASKTDCGTAYDTCLRYCSSDEGP